MIKYKKILETPEVIDITNNAELSIKTLTKEELEAIRAYSLERYFIINKYLRMNRKLDIVRTIDSGLDKFNYNKKIKVFRKIYLTRNNLKYFLKHIQNHGYIIDKAYQSTSLNPFTFDEVHNIFMEIEIEDPSKGGYIAPICEIPIEQEFLLKRNTKIDVVSCEVLEEQQLTKIKGRIK